MRASCSTKKVKIIGASGKMGKAILELVQDDPEIELSEDADVIIDFSSPEGTLKAIEMQKPLVCGTTGLLPSHFEKLQELSRIVPVLYSPNFSLGIALCFEILQQMKEKLKKFYSIEIQEVHCERKKDSPSGTALKMAEILGLTKEMIHPRRVPEMIFHHQVNFSNQQEQISLTHDAYSRKAFAHGALAAAKFILNKPPKLYNINDIFS